MEPKTIYHPYNAHHFSAHQSPSCPHATCQDHLFQELCWWPWLSPSRHPDQMAFTIDCFPVSTETQLVFWKHHRLYEPILWVAGCCGSAAPLCPAVCDPTDSVLQAFLSFTISQSLLKLNSIESVMPSNYVTPFSSGPQSFPASGSFPMSRLFMGFPGGVNDKEPTC